MLICGNGMRIYYQRTANKFLHRYEIIAKNSRGIIALYETAHTKRGAEHKMALMIETVNRHFRRKYDLEG